MAEDNWVHRSEVMKCDSCMWWVEKKLQAGVLRDNRLGRCRRHAPTMNGFVSTFSRDWCGDHRLDENKVESETKTTE